MALFTPERTGLLRHAHTFHLGVAGAESNVAIGIRRLGGRSAWIGRVGDDELGRLVLRTLAAEGVDLQGTYADAEAPTGLMIKEHRMPTVTRVTYYRAGSAGSRLRPEDVPADLVRAARAVHVTGITPALSGTARDAVYAAMETARAAGVTVSLDFNYRSALWNAAAAGKELRALTALADVVFATVAEARLVTDGAAPAHLAAEIAALGPRHTLIKLGERGVVAHCDGQPYEYAALPVSVVDPVGAGDAFAAAYLVEFGLGRPVDECLTTAVTAGAFAVTVPGDWEGMPSRAELDLLRADDDPVLR
ncbi:MAG: sugar kinase [Streptosporangiales bacterium]|nr:sugar kinase [Streptosporangiales bacterium]